jgi:hypothetical protein
MAMASIAAPAAHRSAARRLAANVSSLAITESACMREFCHTREVMKFLAITIASAVFLA